MTGQIIGQHDRPSALSSERSQRIILSNCILRIAVKVRTRPFGFLATMRDASAVELDGLRCGIAIQPLLPAISHCWQVVSMNATARADASEAQKTADVQDVVDSVQQADHLLAKSSPYMTASAMLGGHAAGRSELVWFVGVPCGSVPTSCWLHHRD